MRGFLDCLGDFAHKTFTSILERVSWTKFPGQNFCGCLQKPLTGTPRISAEFFFGGDTFEVFSWQVFEIALCKALETLFMELFSILERVTQKSSEKRLSWTKFPGQIFCGYLQNPLTGTPRIAARFFRGCKDQRCLQSKTLAAISKNPRRNTPNLCPIFFSWLDLWRSIKQDSLTRKRWWLKVTEACKSQILAKLDL